METSEVNKLLEGQTSFASEENGLKIYYVLLQEEREDRVRGFRVFSIGQPADRPTKCVLLLGETGAGKTTFINGAINYLFGVRFKDSFRLRVKEETEDTRMKTESQTDLITAYTIYYKEGMKHEYNFVFIDTPGLADTRGAQQQQDVNCRLKAFLTSDFGVDDLNCVGLVAKANTNRDFYSQKTLLGEVISLLGDTVPDITHIIATFGVDKPIVDTVMKNAGVSFKSVFQFDNGALFSSQIPDTIVPLRWNIMSNQYQTFIGALINFPSVSIEILREKKLFNTCKKDLKVQIEKLGTSITAMESDKKVHLKYELQEAKNKEWMQKEIIEKKITIALEDGIHAHNCNSCQQTCIFPCYKNTGNNIQAGLAGGVGGTAAGAVAANLTTSTIASAASASGLAASVGNIVSQTLGGAITATEVAAVGVAGATTSVALGGVLGIAAGLCTKAMFSKITNSCGVVGIDSVCNKDGCTHSLSDHIKEEKIIVKEIEIQQKSNADMKELYDVATSKKLDANANIINGLQKILNHRRRISHITVKLMHHAKRIHELTSQNSDYIKDVTCQLSKEIRMGEPNIIPYAVKSINILEEAMIILVACTTDEVLGKHGFVEEMLKNSYSDH